MYYLVITQLCSEVMGIRSAQFFLRPEASGNTRHGEGDQVVQVTVGGVGKLQGPTHRNIDV